MNINKINPLPNVLLTIGILPSSYLVSMTYEEQLLWLCNFLKTEVIPKTNANIEAVNQLITYIDNYFDNLDVQDEINNKLDEMLESGELQEIITEYLQINGVLGFNTISDMVNATNIINGSICRTLGLNTYNDGKGAFYKIRTITSEDVVDGINIIALNISNTLIAEKIPNYFINDLQNQIGNLNNLNTTNKSSLTNALNEVKNIADGLTEFVIIGDSWSDPNTSIWVTKANEMLNLNVHNYAVSGAGFVKPENKLMSEQVTALENDTTFDKNKVKYVVVEGGVNDYFLNNVAYNDLRDAVINLLLDVKSICPNAKILLVTNFVYPYGKVQGSYFERLAREVSATNLCNVYNMDGTMGYEVINQTNYYHLTNAGQLMMATNIVACLTGGELINYPIVIPISTTEFNGYYTAKRIGDMVIMSIDGSFKEGYGSLTLSNLTGNQVFPYADLWNSIIGIVVGGYKNVVCSVGINNIAIACNELYYGKIHISCVATLKQ